MHSKVVVWDYFYKNKNGINLNTKGIKSFVIEDLFVERLLKDKLPKKDLAMRIFVGSEITKSFIEDNFFNLSLFSESSNFLILNAELIPLEALSILYNELNDYNESYVFLFFQKTNKNILDLMKKSALEVVELEGAKFWEGPKLFQFLLKEMNLNLPANIQKYILENVEHHTENFFQIINSIKINFEGEEITLQNVIPLVKKDRFDFFEELNDFHQNKLKFFKQLDQRSSDYEWMREISVSMQAHLVKVLNPDELRGKDRLNKYEQNILNWSEKESREELKKYLAMFAEIEILSKLKNFSLKDKIRLEILAK